MTRIPVLVLCLVLGACDLVGTGAGEPDGAAARVSCGGGEPFPLEVLAQPGGEETADDLAAAALREHLAEENIEIDMLPDTGWRVAVRDGARVVWVADDPAAPGSWVQLTMESDDGAWRVTGWGGCPLQPDVGPGLGIASFRVAPNVELNPDMDMIDVLVTERACNSGEDALGRIVPPLVTMTDESVTVVFAVRPRAGGHECPSNPETPFVLELAEPLGDRVLLDGSSVPPRDATACPDVAVCP